MKRLAQIEKSYMKDTVPAFKAGDTVKVHVKIKEGDKVRVQVFQGTVISRRGGGTGETFTVRKMSSGIGVERIFLLHSPSVSKIQRVRKGKVHRAKLYYLRGLTGKSARIEEKLEEKVNNASAVESEPANAEEAKEVKEKKTEKKASKEKKKVKAKKEAKARKETKPEAKKEKVKE